jgi:dUTP pyrophosphatase
MTSHKIKIYLMSEHATLPTRNTPLSAGLDLYPAYEYEIPPQGKALVVTDLQVELPPGTYGRIAARSGYAWNHHISIGAGVIDQDYRGVLMIMVLNHSHQVLHIHQKEAIAQLICEQIIIPDIEMCPKENLSETERQKSSIEHCIKKWKDLKVKKNLQEDCVSLIPENDQ